MLDRDGTPVALAAANALRAGAPLSVKDAAPHPGAHFARIYRRRREHVVANGVDVDGLDDAIARFDQADKLDGLAVISSEDREYSAFLCFELENAVVACLSTPSKPTSTH